MTEDNGMTCYHDGEATEYSQDTYA